jgi:CBS domain containing-hemolysin-like protein
MTLTGILLATTAFLALNALFVAAEFALIGASRLTLERLAAEGDTLAGKVARTVSTPRLQDRYLATAQLGITIASLALGMFGEHAFAAYLEEHAAVGAGIATAISLTLLTLAHIVVGEMLPKGIALQSPVAVARWAHWPMQSTLLALYPFVVSLNALANTTLRVFGVRRQQNAHEHVYTPEELQLIVEESEKGGTIGGESGKILQELLEFGDLTAAQAMVPRVHVIGIPLGTEPDEVRRLIREHGRTRYPVYEDSLDQVVGMLHVKDLLRAMLRDEPVSAAGLRRIPVVPESATLDVVLATMQQTQAHMALVIDEHGGTAGIVSLEDLFEEVVGEIEEGQPATRAVEPQPDGSVRVAGTLRLDELGQHFGIDLEHDEVESVGGLVLARLDRMPAVGDTVGYEGLAFTVVAVSGRSIQEVLVSRDAEPA